MKTARRIQVIAAIAGMVTGFVLVDGEPTNRELFGGAILILVVVADLLVSAYRGELLKKEE